MPKGIPVATVAIGNAANAGLLAVRILAVTGGVCRSDGCAGSSRKVGTADAPDPSEQGMLPAHGEVPVSLLLKMERYNVCSLVTAYIYFKVFRVGHF